jgi:hypothetical protein
MKYLLMLQASDAADGASGRKLWQNAVGRFDEKLIRAGVLLASERVAANGTALVECDGDDRRVTDGTMPGMAELRALWIVQVGSHDEAVEWARRSPISTGRIEVRRVWEEDEPDSAESAEPFESVKAELWHPET